MLALRQFLEFTPARAQKPWHAERMTDQRLQGTVQYLVSTWVILSCIPSQYLVK